MKEYTKPVVIASCDASEGVYTASGVVRDVATCDSIYMLGVWQKKGNNKDKTAGYKAYYGCHKCPANTGGGCKILNGQKVDPSEVFKPLWEEEGHGEKDPVTVNYF